jgi:hypothetical protein
MQARAIRRMSVLAGLVAVTLFLPARANATEEFPAELKRHWDVSRLPVNGVECLLCHKNAKGLTPDQPFGRTVFRRGAKKDNASSLRNALSAIRSGGDDSDGDHVSDYQEIKVDGTSPNDARDFKLPPEPTGGQGGEAGGGGASDGASGGTTSGPTYYPPPAFDAPPPFEHGCALANRASGSAFHWLALLGLGTLLGRRPRQRRRSGERG